MRINKFIAENSSFSRRKADELIEQGKVLINGKKISLGENIDPEKDRITVENKPITPQKEKLYIALNKPKGYVTTRSDELGRKTVMDLVPKNMTIKPVGRLDKDTEGLLLLSNDGDFINRITHPKFEQEKEYYAETKGPLTPLKKERLERGILIENKKTSPAKITIMKITDSQTFLKIVIHEGRKRQIRKMFASVNTPVKYLQRIRIGKLKLGNLPLGKFKKITLKDINADKLT